MPEPIWLSLESVILFNKIICQRDGNTHAVPMPLMVQSAVDAPINHWHYDGADDVILLAAMLAHRIAKNHGFFDANKRTAFTSMVTFLALNKVATYLPSERENTKAMVALETEAMALNDFAGWLRERSVELGAS